MARWLVADSLYNDDAYWCGHLDSLSWYLREAGEGVTAVEMIRGAGMKVWRREPETGGHPDVLLVLDDYARAADFWRDVKIKIAQVAAICNPMPWNVRKPDGSPAYDLVVSSIPWMVEESRAAGCRAELMGLAFDHRALAAAMMVRERDIPCLFVGTRDGNHLKREAVLRELGDLVTIAPPTFGRAYYQLLARAKVIVHVQANWGAGCRNALRYFEGAGLGAVVVGDGPFDPNSTADIGWQAETPEEFRGVIMGLLADERERARAAAADQATVLQWHGYHNRVPALIDLARSLFDGGAGVR